MVAPWPRELGLVEVTVGGALKVAVIAELTPRVIDVVEEGQGLVVPPQLVVLRSPLWPLQPWNVEPPPAAAVIR